jgi:hypothetical protein
MSTSFEGCTRRNFIIGRRLWPPAMTFTPSAPATASSASRRLLART